MSSMAIYLVGFILLVGGLAFGAYLVGVPLAWIVLCVTLLIVAGLLLTTKRKRPKA